MPAPRWLKGNHRGLKAVHGFALLIYQEQLAMGGADIGRYYEGHKLIIERGLRKSRLVPRFRCAFIALIDEAEYFFPTGFFLNA